MRCLIVTSRCSSGAASISCTTAGRPLASAGTGDMAKQSTLTALPVSSCRCRVTDPTCPIKASTAVETGMRIVQDALPHGCMRLHACIMLAAIWIQEFFTIAEQQQPPKRQL